MTEAVQDWQIDTTMSDLRAALQSAVTFGSRSGEPVSLALSELVNCIERTTTLVQIATEEVMIETANTRINESTKRIEELREKL